MTSGSVLWADCSDWAGWADWTVMSAPCVSMTCLRVVRWAEVDEMRLAVTYDAQVTAMTEPG